MLGLTEANSDWGSHSVRKGRTPSALVRYFPPLSSAFSEGTFMWEASGLSDFVFDYFIDVEELNRNTEAFVSPDMLLVGVVRVGVL